MKPNRPFFSICIAIMSIATAAADTIYSNLLDIPIPTDFTGVTVNINGGTINPFFGGSAVANNDLFQPVRTGTGNLDSLANLLVGSVVDVSDLYSTGYGGSQTHLGTTFNAGDEGYVGFKLNGTGYGWMRVIFTGNTDGAVIRDYAYDTSGPIVVGRVNQSAVSEGAQIVTLSPDAGESFTLGSLISDTGGNINSVIKTGAGTTILSQSNTYTGATTINAGILAIDGSITSSVTVNSGGTLGGSGTITGDLTVKSGGTHAAGNSPGTETVSGNVSYESGSIFAWDLAANVDSTTGTRGTDYDAVNLGGTLDIAGGAIFRVIQNSGVDFSANFWDTARVWNNIFNVAGATTPGWASNPVSVYNTSGVMQDVSTYGSFTVTGTTLSWSAVPEPTSAFAGLLVAAGMFRRRRESAVSAGRRA